ncbi:Protein of unknown function [Pyronema omphalodes CBS 100304]|uniref:Uncharacterized protein n=1 Tax=Pyronema omphalodes (strain CBS 100304) TaxID=1076935 RepID=U4LCK3_PYROM|nr:Protein of unknown function [Pyronema omphalodes CBS 100304]
MFLLNSSDSTRYRSDPTNRVRSPYVYSVCCSIFALLLGPQINHTSYAILLQTRT